MSRAPDWYSCWNCGLNGPALYRISCTKLARVDSTPLYCLVCCWYGWRGKFGTVLALPCRKAPVYEIPSWPYINQAYVGRCEDNEERFVGPGDMIRSRESYVRLMSPPAAALRPVSPSRLP